MNTLIAEKPDANAQTLRLMPHNVQAEQLILGAILTNNDLVNRISDFFLAEFFFEPIHSKIYETIIHFMEKSIIASPITLKNYFDKEEALKDIGGAQYLVKLASLATTIINVVDYAKIIHEFYIRRQLIAIGEDIVNSAYDKEIEASAITQIEQAEQELYTLASEGIEGNSGFKQIKSSLSDAVNRISLAFKNQEQVTGISTGFHDMDALLAGFQDSDLIILAGRPSMGKTALAVNLALNCCNFLYENSLKNKDNQPAAVGFFSLEMSAEQLSTRMLAMVSEVSSGNLRSGKINEYDFSQIMQATKKLQLMPFFIDDTPAITISALRTRARRLKRKHNLAVLVIDYLQLIRGVSKHSQTSRVNEISEITQGLKAIAKELNIPVIALSQLSRAVEQREDKRPLLSDLRESGSIEQDADIVMFIYRDEYYLSRRMPKEGSDEYHNWQSEMDLAMNVAEVIISKQRNGPIGNVKLQFNANTTKFNNLAKAT